MDGIVYERPLPDGRAEVTVQLHTRNALSFAITEPDADFDAKGQPIFGYRPQDIVEDFQADGKLDVTPSVGTCFLHVVLMNPAVGAALPDLVVFLGLGDVLPGQELVSIAMFADANGTVRDAMTDRRDRSRSCRPRTSTSFSRWRRSSSGPSTTERRRRRPRPRSGPARPAGGTRDGSASSARHELYAVRVFFVEML